VDDALRRFETGTYGLCRRCASPIANERLEALPHVRLCMPCQRRADAERRRPAR
jgi:RNA polymerase-binding transcription factor DksA